MELSIALLIIGLLLGALLSYVVVRQSSKQSKEVTDSLREALHAAEIRLDTKNNENNALIRENSRLNAENKAVREQVLSSRDEIEQTKKSFQTEFENIANKLFEEKSKKFTEINNSNISALLKPLGENIETFKKRVEEVYSIEAKERFSLGNEVKALVKMNQIISLEAKNLTNALKGDSKVQGDWGEMILENILEKSGLVRGREYFVQESVNNEDGKRFRPDVILEYPDKRKVVIDSKVSLVAYERYTSAETDEQREQFLKEHIRSIKNHIDSLSGKNYDTLIDGSLDFTMLFVAVEPAYMLVLQKDSEIWNYAYQKKILLISPTNLIASLKLIADLWKRDNQSKNAYEIAKRGAQLYDKFYGFIGNMERIGENIRRTQGSFDDAMGQLRDGRGNLISQVETIKKLGAKPKNQLPQSDDDE